MRIRKQAIGNYNMVGRRVEQRRKELGVKQKELLARLQDQGIELNSSGLSKLEGQLRKVNDAELVALSRALDVSMEWLVGLEK